MAGDVAHGMLQEETAVGAGLGQVFRGGEGAEDAFCRGDQFLFRIPVRIVSPEVEQAGGYDRPGGSVPVVALGEVPVRDAVIREAGEEPFRQFERDVVEGPGQVRVAEFRILFLPRHHRIPVQGPCLAAGPGGIVGIGNGSWRS